MKGKNYLIAYVSAIVIGILLLIFHDRPQLYQTLVIAIGALIAVPSLVLILVELFHKKKKRRKEPSTTEKAEESATNWASLIAGVAGLVLGIWMLCNPAFFIKAIIYTLGAILILVGIVQIIAFYQAARPLKPLGFWFIIPVLSLIAGLVIILLGPEKVTSAAGLIAGIVLVVYAANGFAATGREAVEKKASEEAKVEASEEATKKIEQ